MTDKDTILKVNHISKLYPGVTALDDVTFSLDRGEVRGLVGENGAGKSTLIKCIMGVETPTSGSIEVQCDGEWVKNHSVEEAQRHGVFANYQTVNIAPELSIAENYFLGNQPTKNGVIQWQQMFQESQKILDRFSIDADPRTKINMLPIAMQAMITISKIAVNDDLRVVIFDEPTALLENEKVEILFRFIAALKESGVSIIYISHRLEEIIEICDTVTVLKDGQYISTKNVAEVDKDTLIAMMVGRQMTDIYEIRHAEHGEPLLEVSNFSNRFNFNDIQFILHRGEILGFFGLVGAGRSELMRAIYGLDSNATGEIKVQGKPVHITSSQKALKEGIGFLTEDRREDGLALGLSIQTNINMNSYHRISRGSIIDLTKEKDRAKQYSRDLFIKTPSIRQLVQNLSGGNQQKVVIAKILANLPEILIFDEPTVGVDVGAKSEIYKIMESLVDSGKGIILISSYLPEVMGLSDRLLVMSNGIITASYGKDQLKEISEEQILKDASVDA
ncbi:MAG: sugar ABC transporter ATP-binding protein [Peptoniphilaceae bacterium]|nr:sugar ABC transporter ATP-binding protein [Peptoniphilaceae bacterium]MDY5766559.1 sugar ABC transporter ATP-binding protein [Peptoniphilaceae bacterium]